MVVAGVNQQPPVHQFRTRPFKPFWDEPKTHPLLLPRDFQPLSLPQNFPPSHLSHLISYSLHCHSSRELQSLNNLKLKGDVRHKAWGRWKARHLRSMERRRQKEHFIPNTETREERQAPSLLSLLCIFFSSMFFFSFAWEEDDNMGVVFFFCFFCFYLKRSNNNKRKIKCNNKLPAIIH